MGGEVSEQQHGSTQRRCFHRVEKEEVALSTIQLFFFYNGRYCVQVSR